MIVPDRMVVFTRHGTTDVQVCYRASQVERAEDLPDGGCRVRIKDAAEVVVAEGAKTVAAAVNRALAESP